MHGSLNEDLPPMAIGQNKTIDDHSKVLNKYGTTIEN